MEWRAGAGGQPLLPTAAAHEGRRRRRLLTLRPWAEWPVLTLAARVVLLAAALLLLYATEQQVRDEACFE